MKFRQTLLLAIVLLNVISTWLHYTDNAIFLDRYPGPAWFTTPGVFATVILMTPIGLLGYWLYLKRQFWLAYGALALYSITSISSPGHYLFSGAMSMSTKMHSLIWLDAIAGISLVIFLIGSSFVNQDWRQQPKD
jgi:hypothetical protein